MSLASLTRGCLLGLFMASILSSLVGCGGQSAQVPSNSPQAGSTKASSQATVQWASDALLAELSVPYRVGADPVNNGRSTSLSGQFYSASKQQTRSFNYYRGQILAAGAPGIDKLKISLSDWTGEWKLDSPQAAEVAAKEGISAIRAMHLSVNRERWRNQQVPESCLVFWEVEGKDGKKVYINASTGEVYQYHGWQY